MPALMAAWLAAALLFIRRPGRMAGTSHAMAASAKYAASRALTASTVAGVAGWDMVAMAAEAAPAGAMGMAAGMAVIIQIMVPAISA